jgi:NAD(P)-dependent dehydrogenase (short-subunit alcohol dehydrogenase family)
MDRTIEVSRSAAPGRPSRPRRIARCRPRYPAKVAVVALDCGSPAARASGVNRLVRLRRSLLSDDRGTMRPTYHRLQLGPAYRDRVPLKRFGEPADAVHFLASSRASYITGHPGR